MDIKEVPMRRFTTVELDKNIGDIKAVAARGRSSSPSIAKTASS